jgi:hypothetical protein
MADLNIAWPVFLVASGEDRERVLPFLARSVVMVLPRLLGVI